MEIYNYILESRKVGKTNKNACELFILQYSIIWISIGIPI